MSTRSIDSLWKNGFSTACSLVADAAPRDVTWLVKVWLAGLFLSGILVFGISYRWGNFNLDYMDWATITGPRLQVLQQALQEGVLPLHISDSLAFHSVTNRYLSVADISISPQYILLLWLPLPLFNLVNLWFLYALGFAGLLVLRRKLKLGVLSFSFLFLIFNFNGGILAHYSAGHASFGGYFLFPWFAWLVFRLLEGDRSWLWTTLMSVLLFAIWLQGSYHQFVWLLILLGGIAIFVPRTFWTIVKTCAITFLVCAFRLLPCILAYNGYRQSFDNAYPSLYALWDNLVNLPVSLSSPFLGNKGLGPILGEWELTTFIGLPATLVLIYFGFFHGLIRGNARYPGLLGPLTLLFALTIGRTLKFFKLLPIPLIQGERVGSRIFSLVLVIGAILAAERLQRWIETNNLKQKTGFLVLSGLGLGLTAIELWQDVHIWLVSNRSKDNIISFDPTHWFLVNNYHDSVYIALIWGGLAISILSILVLGWLSWREHRSLSQPIPAAA